MCSVCVDCKTLGMDRSFLEGCLAKGMSLEAIGREVGKDQSTVGYWLKRHCLKAVGAEKHRQKGAVRQTDLQRLIDGGATTAEMAVELDRSPSTIRYWLARHEIEPVHRRGPRKRVCGGAKTAVFECKRHGTAEFALEGRGHYRCKRCRSEAVSRRRRTIKQKLVEEAGGVCVLCGYSRWVGALQFHHVDPRQKRFQIGAHGQCRSLARCRAEARKCVLLCATCHAEVEGGFATLPKDLRLPVNEMNTDTSA